MGKNSSRKANIELLRIVSMLEITALHYLYWNNAILQAADSITLLRGIGSVIESLCIPSVACYVLISGYCDRSTQFRADRILRVVVQVWFWSVVLHLLCAASGRVPLAESVWDLAVYVLPIMTGHYWFASAFVVMEIFAPLLNAAVEHVSRKTLKGVLAALLIYESVIKTILPIQLNQDGMGYDFGFFLMMFLIGAWLRTYGVPACLQSKETILPHRIGQRLRAEQSEEAGVWKPEGYRTDSADTRNSEECRANPVGVRDSEERKANLADVRDSQERGANSADAWDSQERKTKLAGVREAQKRGANLADVRDSQERGSNPAGIRDSQERGSELSGTRGLDIPRRQASGRRSLAGYLISCAVIALVQISASFLHAGTGSFSWLMSAPFHYNYLFAVTGSICLFLVFTQIEVPEGAVSNWIRRLAPLSFGVYLIQCHSDLLPYWPGWFASLAGKSAESSNPIGFFLWMLGSVCLVYLICSILEALRRTLFDAAEGIVKRRR